MYIYTLKLFLILRNSETKNCLSHFAFIGNCESEQLYESPLKSKLFLFPAKITMY